MDLSYSDYRWDMGAFRQLDLTPRAVYDRTYLETRYAAIDDNVQALSWKRLRVLEAFVPSGMLLDFGCGTGRFVDAALHTGNWAAYGHDLTYWPTGEHPYGWRAERFLGTGQTARAWDVVTFFDSLEHLPDPAITIAALAPRWLMISVPECHYPHCREWFIGWKHRRPGEHLWHWDRKGLDDFLRLLGYQPLMHSCFEDEFRPRYDPSLSNILTAIYQKC